MPVPENHNINKKIWCKGTLKFNIHGSVHRSNLLVITNEMQLGNGIYYSLVH